MCVLLSAVMYPVKPTAISVQHTNLTGKLITETKRDPLT